MLKSYKITLHPEVKTIIESVTYWTKLGFIWRDTFGYNFKFLISFISVYLIYAIIIFVLFILTNDKKFFF